MQSLEEQFQKAKETIEQARGVFVLTGAGVSAESGVPTFRDAGGLWRNIDPYKVATPEAFAEDPKFVWEWYDARRQQLATVKPNPAHDAIASLEKQKESFFLLTQNVDDLHESAGSSALAHVHGKIWEVRCTKEGTIREDRRAPLPELPPHCPNCGALERPNVVWIGEIIDMDAVQQTERFLARDDVDVAIVIGTEATFGYIMEWSMRSRGSQGTLIVINPGRTALTPYADLYLSGRAGEILPQIIPNSMKG